MKHITLIALAATLSGTMNAQIFTSGVEDWAEDLPSDFMGSKTNLAASGITQVDTDVHGGQYAVRLANPNTSHSRFTTQPVSVTDQQGYNVTFWVRGNGEIRIGLFDDRTSGSGYAPYSAYTVVNSSTWQEVSLNITAANTTDIAEFILSLRNTVEPDHLVVDDVTITEVTIEPPPVVTIAEIQGTGDVSPYADQMVTTSGVITAVNGTSGYFMQAGAGPWSGIYVFTPSAAVTRGDSLSISGLVTEFNGQTQISNVSSFDVHNTAVNVPPTIVTTAAANTEPYESVLVQVVNVNCTAQGEFGQYTMNDGSGPVLVDDVLYAHPFDVGSNYDIIGVLQYAFSEWRILPRDVNDVSIATAVGELAGHSISVFPNPAQTQVTLDLAGIDGRTEATIADATGRVVFAALVNAERSVIDVTSLRNGLYVLTLRTGGSVWSTRLQVQH